MRHVFYDGRRILKHGAMWSRWHWHCFSFFFFFSFSCSLHSTNWIQFCIFTTFHCFLLLVFFKSIHLISKSTRKRPHTDRSQRALTHTQWNVSDKISHIVKTWCYLFIFFINKQRYLTNITSFGNINKSQKNHFDTKKHFNSLFCKINTAICPINKTKEFSSWWNV